MRFAFYGRVSTQDNQDPQASYNWQFTRARGLIEPARDTIAADFFDIGTSRSLPWKRRPCANELLVALKNPGADSKASSSVDRNARSTATSSVSPSRSSSTTARSPDAGLAALPSSDMNDRRQAGEGSGIGSCRSPATNHSHRSAESGNWGSVCVDPPTRTPTGGRRLREVTVILPDWPVLGCWPP